MLMNYGKEYVLIILKLVMYVFIYKLIKEIKVGFFILKNYVICLNVKKKKIWYWGNRGLILI